MAQVPVETSKEKVIISGSAYYIHKVKKGQTAYSISKAYGIAVQDLTAENPPALYGLKEGQSLRIPVRTVSQQQATNLTPAVHKDEARFVYHKLNPGETVYSLSRTYGVSENEIVQSNKGIEINKLSVGSEIAVPKRVFMTEKQKFNDQEKKYIYHKVQKGETLASIADKYGIPLRVLRRENRNLRFPKVGYYVKIPGTVETLPEQPEQPLTDPSSVVSEETVVKLERPAGFTEIKELEGSMDIAVLLPFYLYENSKRTLLDSTIVKGKKQYNISRMPEEWIYPRSLDFIEMYNGILLAADTLRSKGLDVNIHTYDIKGDTVAITRLIRAGKLAGMDLIIGPVFSRNLAIVSEYAKGLGIPVVSPVSLMNNSVLTGNPKLFLANSSIEVPQKALAKKISEDNNNNLVFIHTDSAGVDPDVKRFKNLILSELNFKMPYEDIKFREFLIYSRSTYRNDSINRLSHALSESINNTVIIASEDFPVESEILTMVHGLSKRFNVRVYAYPSVLYIDNLDPKVFFDLNMLVYAPYYINYSKDNVKRFNQNYKKRFLTMPPESSYAWIGYDLSYYFISGLAMHGKDFLEHPEIHNPELLQIEFEFERKSPDDGFENHKLFKIRYSKDYEVSLEE